MNTARPYTTSRQVFHVLVILTMLFSQFGLAVGSASAARSPARASNPPALASFMPVGAETISAGNLHTCAIKKNGSLACWGDNTYGQSTPPAGTFTQVSAGDSLSCGIRTDGGLACWGGDANYGGATVPAGTDFVQVSAGGSHACALKTDGTLACWGYNSVYGQATPPAGTFTQVSAGAIHTCAVQTDGNLACWGWGKPGQGDERATPPAGTFNQVSAGTYHTCGVKSDQTVVCWGAGTTNTGWPNFGQSMPPTDLFKQISAGYGHTCGINTDGTLACWGWDASSQSTPPGGQFAEVSASRNHTCGLRSGGSRVCWGDDSNGEFARNFVGLVTDAGGTSDQGFNWLSWQGVLQAESDLNIAGTLYEPGLGAGETEYEAFLQQCVDDGNDLCVGVGFMLGDAIKLKAAANPGVDFAIIDNDPESPSLTNLRGLMFASGQVGYLAGTLAGKMTSSNTVGDIGGMPIPSVTAFTEGFRNGAQCANPDVQVLMDYTGDFGNPASGEAMAMDMINNHNADVIYAAAGPSGSGAILYSSQHGKWSIGVDTDQYLSIFGNGTVPGSNMLLTSTMKRTDVAIYLTIQDTINDEFTSGSKWYNLANGGVGLAPYHETDGSIPPETKTYINNLSLDIQSGSVDVNDTCRGPGFSYTLHVNLKGNEVHGHGWPSGDIITLTIDNDMNPGNGVLYSQTKNADDAPDCGYPCFNGGSLFSLERGQYITMTDETVTKNVQISTLNIDEVNAGSETISGVADPGSTVKVKINSQSGNARFVTAADPGGAWSVDFSIPGVGPDNPATTLNVGDNGAAIQIIPGTDEDGTLEYWQVPNPRFTVQPDHGWVQGQGWPAGHTLSLTLDDPGNGSCSVDDQIVGGDGSAWFQVEPKCDLHVGETVTMTDGISTKSTVIQEVHFDTIHEPTDTALGRGPSDQPANVYVRTDTGEQSMDITIPHNGEWSATLGGLHPIQNILDANIQVFDPDGDGTMAHLRIPNFQARMTENEVHGYNWPLGKDVTLNIDDPSDPDYGPVTLMAVEAPWDPSQTFVQFNGLGTFTLKPGQIISMSDGDITKTLTVTDLQVTNFNTSLDTVSGTSSSGETVEVGYLCDPGGCAARRVNPSGGNWQVDFKAAPGAPTPEEQYPYDIKGGDRSDAIQYDIDNDGTEHIWKVSYPENVSVPRGNPIQLAASLDLSDGAADIGRSALKAIQMAVRDFGGIKGFAVRINIFDSQCGDQMIGYKAAADIIANTQNAGVLGHTCSTSFMGGLPVYESVDMVTISGSTTIPSLPDVGPSVFNRTTLYDPFANEWLAAIRNLPAVRNWSARYHAQYGTDPTDYAVLFYDAATIMLQRIRSTSTLQGNGSLLINRSALASAVRGTTNQNGISGSITLDSQGNRTPVCYMLTTAVNPAAGGNVLTSPSPSCSGGRYYEGTLVQLTAMAAAGFNFFNWSGAVNVNANPATVLMNGNKTVNANFYAIPPGAFGKSTPTNGSGNQPTSITLTWGASPFARSYQYCIDTSNNNSCNGSWVNVGTSLSAALSNLNPNTTYFWQVRAMNSGGSTYANGNAGGGAWWSFSTLPCYTLNTAASPGGSGSVRVDLGPNCSGSRYIAGTVVHLTATPSYGRSFSNWSGAITGSNNPATLMMNGNKNVVANFVPTPPGPFGKNAPANGSTNIATNPQLSWQTSQYATGYLYCIDTSNNNTCDTSWVNVGSNLSVALGGLSRNTTFYWQVRAVNSGVGIYANGNASGGTWWSFKTRP